MRALGLGIVASLALLAVMCGAPPPHSLSSSVVDAGLCRPSPIDARDDGASSVDAGGCMGKDASAGHQ